MRRKQGWKRIYVMLAIGMLLTGLFPQAGRVHADSVTPTGNFQVIGSKIYDPDGNEFIARGTNINGLNWVWSREVTQDADLIQDVWNFNVVRVNSMLKPLAGSPQFTTNNDLDAIVDAFTSRKVVVMFEAHDFTNGIPETNPDDPNKATLADLEDWLEELAEKYSDNPYVWFNLYNEPGGAPVPQYETVSRELISTIRQEAPDNIIVVDGGYSGQDTPAGTDPVSDAQSSILTYGQGIVQGNTNVIFSVHMYGNWNGAVERFEDYIDRVHNKGLAIIIGEFSSNATTSKLYSAVKAAIQVSAEKGIGWLTWCWVNGDGYLTATDDGGGYGVDRTNGDKPTNLTWFGDKVWDYAHGQVPAFDKHDLSVAEVIPDKGRISQGDEIRFAATLQNVGDVDLSGTVKVDFRSGGQVVATGEYTGTIPRFGSASIVSDAITVSSSDMEVTVAIDTTNSTYGIDDDSNNNERTLELSGGSPSGSGYDLMPEAIALSKSQPKYGDLVDIDVTVRNQGDTASPNSWTTINFYVNGIRMNYVGDTVSIPAGETRTFTLENYLITQTKDFALAASLDNKDGDLNHSNDKIFKTILLQSDEENEDVNLVLNPGFESGTATNWQFWGGSGTGSVSSEAGDSHSGDNALKVSSGGGGYYLELEPHTSYVLSAYGKNAVAGDTFSFGIQYNVDNAGTPEKHIVNFNSTDYSFGQFIFTTPDNITAGTTNVFVWKGAGTGAFYLDDITLQKATNLVLNSGFESGAATNWQFWGGSDVGAVTSASDNVHGGVHALEVSRQGGGYYQDLEPNTTYVLSAYGKNANAGDTFSFGVQYDKDDAGTQNKHIITFDSADYTSGQISFTTPDYVKAGTANVFVWKGSGTGAFYLDDITLRKATNLLLNSGFESGTASPWQLWGGSGASAVTDAAGAVNSGSYALEVTHHGGGQYLELEPNTTYIASAYGKNTNADSVSFGVQYQIDDAGTNEQHTTLFFGTTYMTRQTVFTTPAYMKAGTANVFFWKSTNATSASYLDDIVLAKAPIQMPPVPGLLAVTSVTAESAVLSWTAAQDSGQTTGYRIYRDNVYLDTVAGNVLSYEDSGLTPATTYSYVVKAVDEAGNESAASNEVGVTTNWRYEAENAALTGVAVASTRAGYSGNGYIDAASFDAYGDKLAFTVNVPSAGTYRLTFRYADSHDKPNSVLVNGSKQVTSFINSVGAWATLDYGEVELNAGDNAIELVHDYGDYGWVDIDYIEVGYAEQE
ncbi:cellulase family glycosylhydrolase [Cohnella fermenti]|uniref:Cellulase n=1 Tax=Cohnella fermenti TaxID=2565925 RepID=A0A4S4BPA1_9BACL|nr:cellulase family glycosylhydrolase [Cohnella fermenti]THF76728.1 hypothetical protein E6C55_18350 [Cohnella fermenti]